MTITAPAGSSKLAGTVSFTLYALNNCTGAVIYGPTQIGVSGASPQTVSTSNTTAITAAE